jgi:hypothetical protein
VLKATPQPLAVRRRALAHRISIGLQPLAVILQMRPIAHRGLAPATIVRQAPTTAALRATLRIVRRVPWAAVIVPIRHLLRATVAILRRRVLTLRLLMAAAAAIPLLAAIHLLRVATLLLATVVVVRAAIAVVVALAVTVAEEVLPTAAAEVVRTAAVVADPTVAEAVTTKIYPPYFLQARLHQGGPFLFLFNPQGCRVFFAPPAPSATTLLSPLCYT